MALKEGLSNKYYFYCPETNKDCRHLGVLRIAPQGYYSECLHLDVFYSFCLPNDENEQQQIKNNILRISKIYYYKKVNAYIESKKSFIQYLYFHIKKLQYYFCNIDKLRIKYDNICKKYNNTDTVAITCNIYLLKDTFNYNYLWDLIKRSTSIGEYYITKNYDMILRKCYKDYNIVPPLINRIRQVLHCCETVRYYKEL